MDITHNTETFKIDNADGLSDRDFSRLSQYIYSECGIKMPPAKRTMLEARLRKRLRALDIKSYREYCDYLFSPAGQDNEIVHMIDVVTTNKTDFFREPGHYDHLKKRVLFDLINRDGAGINRPLMVWSAGCATGEEPYTLGMVLSEFSEGFPGFSFKILATDISTRVLETARTGIYREDRILPVPELMKKKYIMVSRDKNRGLVRIVPALRETVKFRHLNFMEDDFGMREPMDIIFCRNVIIYFDRPTQEKLLNRFCRHLSNGGYLFIGHSETLNGLNVPLVQVSPTIYRKP